MSDDSALLYYQKQFVKLLVFVYTGVNRLKHLFLLKQHFWVVAMFFLCL